MARKRKSIPQNLEEQIAQLEAEILEHKEAIKELNAKLKEVREAKKQADMDALMVAITASGKTVEEILAALQQENFISGQDQ